MDGRIVTERLVLEPLSRQTAQAVLDGLPDGLRRGEGWPHADTLDALGMVAKHGSEKHRSEKHGSEKHRSERHDSEEDGSEARGPEAWLILEDGLVVGDAGTYGPPDAAGDVEIGYGLAEPARGKGLASEFVPALALALLARSEVRRVVAREVLAENVPSRRALERAGFRLEREQDGLTWYALGPFQAAGDEPSTSV